MTTTSTPKFTTKAAVLCARIALNHPLPDGNKRLAWQCLTLFCALNGRGLHVPPDDAVATMLAVAAGEVDEPGLDEWLGTHLESQVPGTETSATEDDR